MHTRDAVALLAPDGRQLQPAGHWLDLGAGDGTFTRALAELLPAGSTIEAVDRDAAALRRIPRSHAGIPIRTTQHDFASLPLAWDGVAGIVLANALHFVEAQQALLAALANVLAPHGTLLVVEYDRDTPKGPWVPYPVSARTLARMAEASRFAAPVPLGRRRSQFGGEIYAAILRSKRDRAFADG